MPSRFIPIIDPAPRRDRLSAGAAADVWEAAQQAVPPRWLAPGYKPPLPLGLLDPLSFEAFSSYEELKREASIRVMAEF